MIAVAYCIYLVFAISAVVLVGRMLSRSSTTFLKELFEQYRDYVDSLRHLLLVGFYLVVFGVVTFTLPYGLSVEGRDEFSRVIEVVSTKMGFLLIFLGLLTMVSLSQFLKFRRQRD